MIDFILLITAVRIEMYVAGFIFWLRYPGRTS
jgi:hypothetical protein